MLVISLYQPGEKEIPLLTELVGRNDFAVRAVLDPEGDAPGTSLAEILGLPVHGSLAAAELPPGSVIVHPDDCPAAADLGAEAADLGLSALSTADFRARFLGDAAAPVPDAAVTPATVPGGEQDVRRALHRIEQMLDRPNLHRTLAALVAGAADVRSVQLMLFESYSRELVTVAAHGPEGATLQPERVPLGEEVSGRVARELRSELVMRSRRAGESGGGHVLASVPLVWNEELVGVVNLGDGDRPTPLGVNDIAQIEKLGERIARVLLLAVPVGSDAPAALRELELCLREGLLGSPSPAAVLDGWAATLREHFHASSVAMGVLRVDGSLLCDSATRQGAGESPPGWREVLESGRTEVSKHLGDAGAATPTRFTLPIGQEPPRGLLSLGFADPAAAHRFQGGAALVTDLLERLVPDLMRRFMDRDRTGRLEDLAEIVTRLAVSTDSVRDRARILQEEVGRISGAASVVVVRALVEDMPVLHDQVDDGTFEWLKAAGPLLRDAGESGWAVVTVDPGAAAGGKTLGLMAVSTRPGEAAPALVLADKRRLHDFDSSVAFTTFDAALVSRLAVLLPPLLEPRQRGEGEDQVPQRSRAPQVRVFNQEPAAAPGPEAEDIVDKEIQQEPEAAEPPPVEEVPADEPVEAVPESMVAEPVAATEESASVAEPEAAPEPPAPAPPAPARRTSAFLGADPAPPSVSGNVELLCALMRREMDRADRYHVSFSLSVFRPGDGQSWSAGQADRVAGKVRALVRSSDYVLALPDGLVAVLAPEETHSVSKLEKRVTAMLCDVAGRQDLTVSIGRVLYPGNYTTPEQMIEAAREALSVPS